MQVLIMCVSNFEVALAEYMCVRERKVGREVLKKVGEQEDIQPIVLPLLL